MILAKANVNNEDVIRGNLGTRMRVLWDLNSFQEGSVIFISRNGQNIMEFYFAGTGAKSENRLYIPIKVNQQGKFGFEIEDFSSENVGTYTAIQGNMRLDKFLFAFGN